MWLTWNRPSNWIPRSRWPIAAWRLVYANLYGPARGAMYSAKAYELRDHASERERLQITADYYANVLGDLPKATEAYTQMMTNYPRYARVRNLLGI